MLIKIFPLLTNRREQRLRITVQESSDAFELKIRGSIFPTQTHLRVLASMTPKMSWRSKTYKSQSKKANPGIINNEV